MSKQYPHLGQLQHGNTQDQSIHSRGHSSLNTGERAFSIPEQSANDPIKVLLDDLVGKIGVLKFGTDENPRFVPFPAATATEIGFSDFVPSPVVSNNTLADMLFDNDMLRAAVYSASSYLRAGVKLAVIADPNSETSRELIHAQHTYCTAEPLNYEFVAEGVEISDQPSPFAFHNFKLGDEASVGASFELSRRTLKDTPDFALRGLLYDAIAGGIGKAIDKAMASHLGQLTLAPFTLAAAAARGLSMTDLAGITSGSSTDAKLDRGELYLKGVNAHLSAAVGNYVFCPSKFAVAVPQNLRITAKNLTNGGIEFVIWLNAEVLATAQSNTAAWTA